MSKIKEKVGFPKKISLSYEVVARPDAADVTFGPYTFEFVYGIGPEGLSMLERELADKQVGETIIVHQQPGHLSDLFGHLALPYLGLEHGTDSCYLKVKVVKIIPADQKEVIRAMADLAQCGNTCCGH
jgi:hypothetical protein